MNRTNIPSVDEGMATLAILLAGLILFAGEAHAQGYPFPEAARHMTAADGFQVKPVAGEPMVRQPVAIEFDDRGRLWVIQYLQYPNPAGLKRVKVDRYSRTVYDRIPEPPPRGPRGADRITILEEAGRDGRTGEPRLKAKDFVTGLNLATGIAFGHGGVFILQAPYLLFYADKNGDDVPDGDPEVLLSGFGMEDAHSVANSLTWGPDGWLYGCQGSTVTAHIRGIEFQQGVWRYHPVTRRFELFCEGGGNSWGLDFDRYGNLFYSTNVGGFCMLHGVQGGYYWKQFGKHGALHNPHAYGFFDHVPHMNFRGGHVTVGGIIYQGDLFPSQFRNIYIAADLLGHNVYWHRLEPWGATFRSSHGGELLLSNDTWFAPSDLTMGPDGAIYVADWNDKRTAHPDPDAEWDKSTGRIYKIEAKGANPAATLDLGKLSSQKLVDLLAEPNDWYVRKARRILGDRRDPNVVPRLSAMVFDAKNDQLALQALWALYVSGGFDEAIARRALAHRDPHVRAWTVRLVGDDGASSEISRRLVELARIEPDVTVRCQLASTAKRLAPQFGLDIAYQILIRDLDGRDPFIPMLLWWAVENHSIAATETVLRLFASPVAWNAPLICDAILGRLMRRYSAEGSPLADRACARLLASVPSPAQRGEMLGALELGLRDRTSGRSTSNHGTLFENTAAPESKSAPTRREAVQIGPELERALAELWGTDKQNIALVRLMARLGDGNARERALAIAIDSSARPEDRVAVLQSLGPLGDPKCVSALLGLVKSNRTEAPDSVRLAALAALQADEKDAIGRALVDAIPTLDGRLRERACEVLLSRKSWALRLLQRIDAGRLPSAILSSEQLRPVALHQDKQLDTLVRKHWGTIQAGTPEEKLAEMRRLSNDLRAEPGNPARGRQLFDKHCATCHRLYGEGLQIGPDLTYANRKDREYLLASIVDPSAMIRKEFLSYNLHTVDGRLLTGLIAEQSPSTVTLVGAKGERVTISRNDIEVMHESTVSLMPENLLRSLKSQEVRDLFGYLQSERPPAAGGR
jgi:putative membrane-bound dehydrogenase-like protein